jgi:hypothetical protein
MARRTIPLILAFVVGWLMILTKFVPSIESWGEDAAVWFDIIAAIAFALGGGNLLKIHTSKVKKQIKGWGYSVITVVCFLTVLTLGFTKLGAVPDKKNPFGLVISHAAHPVCWVIVGDTPHVAVLDDGESMVLGRGETADVVLDSFGVADAHCKITRQGDAYVLEDLGSETGVYLEGERLQGPTEISAWDKIRVGDVGDPVVIFREDRTYIRQIGKPEGNGKVITLGTDGAEYARLAKEDRGLEYVPVIGRGLEDGSVRLKFGDGNDVELIREGETGTKLEAGDTFQLGSVAFAFRPSGKITGIYNEFGRTGFWYCYQYGFRPLQQAIFAMLAFYVASAAFRAFRAKNIEAIVLLATAFLILLGRTYLGTLVTAWFPESMEGYTVPSLTVWIMQVINTAGNRAIMIGIALGVASTSLKVILGVDRSYLGGEE